MCVCVCVCVCNSECVCIYVCVLCMDVRVLHVRVCMEVDAVYNLILFQLRYIIFTCILHANVRQHSCVVREYVGCIKIYEFYFHF